MTILITGGAGYIGSHTVVELMAAGHETFIIDNLCNSKASMLAHRTHHRPAAGMRAIGCS